MVRRGGQLHENSRALDAKNSACRDAVYLSGLHKTHTDRRGRLGQKSAEDASAFGPHASLAFPPALNLPPLTVCRESRIPHAR